MCDRKNSNRQDIVLGGTILAGFLLIAVIAALFTLARGTMSGPLAP